jgi:hypothetical protein
VWAVSKDKKVCRVKPDIRDYLVPRVRQEPPVPLVVLQAPQEQVTPEPPGILDLLVELLTTVPCLV